MFMITAKISKKKIITGLLLIIAIPFLIILFSKTNPSNITAEINGETKELRRSFLLSMGWQTDGEYEEISTITVPQNFDKIYTQYNEIQKEQGFDLSRYKGLDAHCYSYRIFNYKDEPEGIYATVIVHEGKIIGGDIHQDKQDGFMHGFEQ